MSVSLDTDLSEPVQQDFAFSMATPIKVALIALTGYALYECGYSSGFTAGKKRTITLPASGGQVQEVAQLPFSQSTSSLPTTTRPTSLSATALPDSPDPSPPFTQEEQAKIERLITLMNDKPIFNPLKVGQLVLIGNDIDSLHPFVFLLNARHATFLKNKGIYRTQFIQGVGKGITREIAEGKRTQRFTISPHLTKFAEAFKKDKATIVKHIQNSKWEELVDYLFDITLST